MQWTVLYLQKMNPLVHLLNGTKGTKGTKVLEVLKAAGGGLDLNGRNGFFF